MNPYIEIQEGERVLIPKKYHKINNLCAIVYDQMTELLKSKEYIGLRKTTIDLSSEKREIKEVLNDLKIQKEEGKDILEWMKDENQRKEVELVVSKEVFRAVTSDLLSFVFESLYAAKRGKMSVAYSLIRKPFTDLLLILEQLYVDRENFIHNFYFDGNPRNYDPSPGNHKIDKKEVIEKVFKKVKMYSIIHDAEMIHDLRYNKELDYGLSGITNHALHIVTNDRRYKTEEKDLNFVFSNKEDYKRYYKHYYTIVPHLLIYCATVVDGVAFNFLQDKPNQNRKVMRDFRRLVGMTMLMEYLGLNRKRTINKMFKELSKTLKITCGTCGTINSIEKADCILYLESELFLCPNCIENIILTDESIAAFDMQTDN